MTICATLREGNTVRQAEWDTGGNVDLSYAGNELAGETGELIEAATDIIDGGSDNWTALAEEMADVIICCDLIALRLDMPLVTDLPAFNAPHDHFGTGSKEFVKDILLDIAMEAGRISNTVKKRERERFGMVGARGSLEDLNANLNEQVLNVYRLGDAMGVLPAKAVADKFNKTSTKYGLTTMMKVPE